MVRKFIDLIDNHKVAALLVASLFFSFLTVTFASQIASFLYPRFSLDAYYNDASIFTIMGKSFVGGKTPYVEVYDHKGLYIFYYTAIMGVFGKPGLFILQFALFSINFFLLGLTAKEMGARKSTVIWIMLLFTAGYCGFGQSPADAEMEMPFMAGMMYCYARGYMRKEDKSYFIGNLLAGFTAGIALNLRITDSVIALSFVVYFGVTAIIQRRWRFLLLNALICLGGVFIACIPPYAHAFAGGFIHEYLDAAYFANFRYVGKVSIYENRILAFLLIFALWGTLFLLTILKRKAIGKEGVMFFVITGGVSFVVQLVIANYPHYLIVTFDYLALSYGLLASKALEKESLNLGRKIVTGVFILGTLACLSTNLIISYQSYAVEEMTTSFIDSVLTEEDKDGHVLVVNAAPAYYLQLGITPGYPDFALQENHAPISPYFNFDAFVSYLESPSCHYAIVRKNEEMFPEFLSKTDAVYELIEPSNGITPLVNLYRHVA